MQGMNKASFMFYLGSMGESVINYSPADLDEELKRFKNV